MMQVQRKSKLAVRNLLTPAGWFWVSYLVFLIVIAAVLAL